MNSNSPILYLYKDFFEQRIVFYWVDAEHKMKSPQFTTLVEAEEWWLKFNYSLHTGPERRSSIVDRRRLHSQRNSEQNSRHIASQTPEGRRYTDVNIRVDKDLSRIKILQFYSVNPDLLET